MRDTQGTVTGDLEETMGVPEEGKRSDPIT